jgi:hypothetical protein
MGTSRLDKAKFTPIHSMRKASVTTAQSLAAGAARLIEREAFCVGFRRQFVG